MLVSILRNQSGLKFKHILVICKQLSHVLFGWFWLQAEYASQRIFRSAVAIERRNLVFNILFFSFFNFYRIELNAQFIHAVGFGKVISIINHTISAENVDMFSNREVSRRVEFLFFQTHPRINCV